MPRPCRTFRPIALATELALARVWLSVRFRQEPVDRLLSSIPARPGFAATASLLHDMLAAEVLVDRIPGVPQTCLARALARFYVLRRRGLHPTFVLGVASPSASRTPGHAWVELDGEPWAESDELLACQVVTFRHGPPHAEARS
jgi:hypothetical protein